MYWKSFWEEPILSRIKLLISTDLFVILLWEKIASEGLIPLTPELVNGLSLESILTPTYAETAGIKFFKLNLLSAQ